MLEEEQPLVQLAKRGDKAAYEKLYRANVGRVYALALRLCGQRALAEDLTQESFIRAWQKLETFKEEAAFSSWLYRLTTNVVVGHLRRQKAWESLTPEHEASCEKMKLLNDKRDLDRAIQTLPDQARTVLVMFEYLGYQHNEIADLTGLAIGTCKAHLHRAKTLLRESLNND